MPLSFLICIFFPDDRTVCIEPGNPATKSQLKQLAAVECKFLIEILRPFLLYFHICVCALFILVIICCLGEEII